MSKENNLNSISGWLLFFIITLVFITPVYSLYYIFTESEFLSFIEFIVSLGEISLFIISGIFLWIRKPYAVKFTKIVLITDLVLSAIMLISLPDLVYTSTIQVFGYNIIWLLYLKDSKRVKEVYGNLKEKSSGFQIWSILAIIYSIIIPFIAVVFAITSIINISKNKKLQGLTLSIIALIISVIFSSFILFGLTLDDSPPVPETTEFRCRIFCNDFDLSVKYKINYISSESVFLCSCLDESSNIIDSKKYPYSFN